MGVLRSKKVLVLLVGTAVAAALAGVGISAVISQTVLVDGTNIHFRIVKTTASDFDSGWHTHPGLAIVQVTDGSLQITQGSCTPRTVNAGDTFIEVPYTPVRATGSATWTTTFLVHYEEPILTPVTTSPCP
jgi:quercetin dioxygenase-like cupin family protein